MTAPLDVQRDGEVVVLVLAGEVGHESGPLLEHQTLVAVRDAEAVVVDLLEVTYLDSAGVTVLDRLVRSCGQRSIPLRIAVREASVVQTVLRIIAFPEELLRPDRAEALAAVRAGRT